MPKIKAQADKINKTIDRLDSVIARKFLVSHMNNSKWVKLLKSVAAFNEQSYNINFKLVHSDDINSTQTEQYKEHVDNYWFFEPLIYKEIQWIEFSFEGNDSLDELIEYLSGIAKFSIIRTETGYLVQGYS
jgi:hypothetical protein